VLRKGNAETASCRRLAIPDIQVRYVVKATLRAIRIDHFAKTLDETGRLACLFGLVTHLLGLLRFYTSYVFDNVRVRTGFRKNYGIYG
jgi:hypothetical protein